MFKDKGTFFLILVVGLGIFLYRSFNRSNDKQDGTNDKLKGASSLAKKECTSQGTPPVFSALDKNIVKSYSGQKKIGDNQTEEITLNNGDKFKVTQRVCDYSIDLIVQSKYLKPDEYDDLTLKINQNVFSPDGKLLVQAIKNKIKSKLSNSQESLVQSPEQAMNIITIIDLKDGEFYFKHGLP